MRVCVYHLYLLGCWRSAATGCDIQKAKNVTARRANTGGSGECYEYKHKPRPTCAEPSRTAQWSSTRSRV